MSCPNLSLTCGDLKQLPLQINKDTQVSCGTCHGKLEHAEKHEHLRHSNALETLTRHPRDILKQTNMILTLSYSICVGGTNNEWDWIRSNKPLPNPNISKHRWGARKISMEFNLSGFGSGLHPCLGAFQEQGGRWQVGCQELRFQEVCEYHSSCNSFSILRICQYLALFSLAPWFHADSKSGKVVLRPKVLNDSLRSNDIQHCNPRGWAICGKLRSWLPFELHGVRICARQIFSGDGNSWHYEGKFAAANAPTGLNEPQRKQQTVLADRHWTLDMAFWIRVMAWQSCISGR